MSRNQDFNKKYFLNSLKTRSEFDVIEERSSHQRRSRSSELISKLNSTLPSSVLTLALIYNICHERERDEELREDFFKAVCDKLCELNYLNSSTIALYKKLDLSAHYKVLSYFLQKVHEQVRSSSTDDSSLALSRSVHECSQTAIALQYPNLYEESFNEIAVIGTGGSGVVCKATHKVDGAVYAVKKIYFKFKTDAEFEKIIREAKSFAALRHRNIVNYNNAWLDYRQETGAKKGNSSDESSSEDSSERSPEKMVGHSNISVSFHEKRMKENVKDEVLHHTECEESSLEIVFDSNIKENGNINTDKHDKKKSLKFKSEKKKSKIHQWTEEDLKEIRNTLSIDCCSLEKLVVKATLYIQMEYCEHDLDSWLQIKNSRSSADMINIFRQILCGVDYIHSKSIIHRDLKPKNIFISEPIVKIGDFGLACLAQQIEEVSCAHCVGESYSAVHGTVPYSAPEQRSGSKYNFKVDLYSLGIILFEFYEMEVTRTEFFKKLEKFRNGQYHMQASEQVENLVKKLIKENPDERPSAEDVLKDPLFKKKSLKKNIKDIQHKLLGCMKQLKELEECVSTLRNEQRECKQLLKSNKEVREQTRIQEREIEKLRDEVNSLRCNN